MIFYAIMEIVRAFLHRMSRIIELFGAGRYELVVIRKYFVSIFMIALLFELLLYDPSDLDSNEIYVKTVMKKWEKPRDFESS